MMKMNNDITVQLPEQYKRYFNITEQKGNIIKLKLTPEIYSCAASVIPKELPYIEDYKISLDNLFSNIKDFYNIEDIKNWDISNVVSMREMFSFCALITEEKIKPIQHWLDKEEIDTTDIFKGTKLEKQVTI